MSQMCREMILLLMMKFLDFIFGDIRWLLTARTGGAPMPKAIPQAGPVFFKLVDFIFSHFSLNMTFIKSFSDFVGLVIDSSNVEQNKGFLNSIGMTQSFLFLLNQMMAIDQQLMCRRKNMMIFNSLLHIVDNMTWHVRHFQFRFCLIKSTSVLDPSLNVTEDFDSLYFRGKFDSLYFPGKFDRILLSYVIFPPKQIMKHFFR